MPSFSKRHGYSQHRPATTITIREDAPPELRVAILDIAYGTGYNEFNLLDAITKALKRRPNPQAITNYDYHDENLASVANCPWYKVYDIIEKLYQFCSDKEGFAEEVNEFFVTHGIGWKLEDGAILFRGTDTFESHLRQAEQVLADAKLTTANTEIQEAINDLSRMPHADITGAIQHSLACLECVAREAAGGSKQTLGELIKSRRDLVPEPLNSAIEKVWGFSSNQGRHLQEGKSPSFEEAELLVGLSAALSTYLVRKFKAVPDVLL